MRSICVVWKWLVGREGGFLIVSLGKTDNAWVFSAFGNLFTMVTIELVSFPKKSLTFFSTSFVFVVVAQLSSFHVGERSIWFVALSIPSSLTIDTN